MVENSGHLNSRRQFIRSASVLGISMPFIESFKLFELANEKFSFKSHFMQVILNEEYTSFEAVWVDSLGNGKSSINPILNNSNKILKHKGKAAGKVISYYPVDNVSDPDWKVTFTDKTIQLISNFNRDSGPFEMIINQELNHATVLGLMDEKNKVKFPCLIHFPDMGTFRVKCKTKDAGLFFDAKRSVSPHFVKIQFPSANEVQKKIEYHMEVVSIHPTWKGIENERLYDGFRKNFINIFQINPQLQVLANNSASDSCAFTLYKYSEVARQTPSLAQGLTVMMLLRQTLDKYLNGFKGYGMVGFQMFDEDQANANNDAIVSDYLDTYPSLLIAAQNYVAGTNDLMWLSKNYTEISAWAEKMLAFDIDKDGVLEYPLSGNSGSWGNTEKVKARPSNWWDTIGFGHKDAYANALAYRALYGLVEIAALADKQDDVIKYTGLANKLKSVYYSTFYNKETGVLAGWKSADGELHDYYFTFVSGAAITYGLIDNEQANGIMDKLLAKMSEVGYTDFSLGLPGNLVPVKRVDYVHKDIRWGGGMKEDGSDGFQIYENGGATACYTYFTIKALQKLGRNKEAEMILHPIMKSITAGGFSGKCENGMTKDWKKWNGECWGYEGFLVDNYLVMLAAIKPVSQVTI